MTTFIDVLRRTRNVAGAARAAGMSRQAAYSLRARLRGHPFDRAWAAAMAPRDALRLMMRDHSRTQGAVSPPAKSPQGMTLPDTSRQVMTLTDTR